MDTYELGPFRLDRHNGVLLRGSEPVVLGGRAVALLRALVERPGALESIRIRGVFTLPPEHRQRHCR